MSELRVFNIDTVHDLLDFLGGFDGDWVFRGQVNSEWSLQPGIERLLPSNAIWPDQSVLCNLEKLGLDDFKRGAHHFLREDVAPKTKLGWLSLMQHHGAPTRLLDFTQSPYVALYFATESVSFLSEKKSAVWAVNYHHINEMNKLRYRKVQGKELCPDVWGADDDIFDACEGFPDSLVMVVDPYVKNQRLFVQQGTFLLASNFAKSLSDSMLSTALYGNLSDYICRVDFSHGIVFQIADYLQNININSNTIYPGIDGFSLAVKERMRSVVHRQVNWL